MSLDLVLLHNQRHLRTTQHAERTAQERRRSNCPDDVLQTLLCDHGDISDGFLHCMLTLAGNLVDALSSGHGLVNATSTSPQRLADRIARNALHGVRHTGRQSINELQIQIRHRLRVTGQERGGRQLKQRSDERCEVHCYHRFQPAAVDCSCVSKDCLNWEREELAS